MHIFDQDISITEQEPSFYRGNVSGNWSINRTPNGGYIMALLAAVMTMHSNKKETPLITANYISKCVPGEITISVEDISQSIQFSRYQARLFQHGKEKNRSLATFTARKDDCFIKRYETSAPLIPPLEKCMPVLALPNYTLYDNMDVRVDTECAGWMTGTLVEKSESRGWIKFKDDRPFDIPSIALIADAFPPAIFASQGMLAWVPTIEFSVSIRNIPVTEWLKCVFRTRFINCGILEEDGEIWDENNELIAISRQIAQYKKG